MSVQGSRLGFTTYSESMVRVFGRMSAPTTPRKWSPEDFDEALREARDGQGMTKQDLVIQLSRWLMPEEVPSLSTVYRWARTDGTIPPWHFLPLICLALGCSVERITRKAELLHNPFDEEDAPGSSTEMKGGARKKRKSGKTG